MKPIKIKGTEKNFNKLRNSVFNESQFWAVNSYPEKNIKSFIKGINVINFKIIKPKERKISSLSSIQGVDVSDLMAENKKLKEEIEYLKHNIFYKECQLNKLKIKNERNKNT